MNQAIVFNNSKNISVFHCELNYPHHIKLSHGTENRVRRCAAFQSCPEESSVKLPTQNAKKSHYRPRRGARKHLLL